MTISIEVKGPVLKTVGRIVVTEIDRDNPHNISLYLFQAERHAVARLIGLHGYPVRASTYNVFVPPFETLDREL